jgi:hypothetical protein
MKCVPAWFRFCSAEEEGGGEDLELGEICLLPPSTATLPIARLIAENLTMICSRFEHELVMDKTESSIRRPATATEPMTLSSRAG